MPDDVASPAAVTSGADGRYEIEVPHPVRPERGQPLRGLRCLPEAPRPKGPLRTDLGDPDHRSRSRDEDPARPHAHDAVAGKRDHGALPEESQQKNHRFLPRSARRGKNGGVSSRHSPPGALDAGCAFAGFAQTRDPRAFAQAFDATAQDLLLVAVRLCRPPAQAEDLVQETWRRALAVAARYDPARPLLPWLIGILWREARRERRDQRRRQRQETLCSRRDAIADTPAAAAQRAEFSADAARALERLDEVHRQVLMLRLLHGLTSTEIALSLGRSPETVRSQLARGLDKLRRRLPAGHALLALATLDLGAVRLAVVRETLLVEVALSSKPLAVGLGVLAMNMKKLTVSIAVALGAITIGVLATLFSSTGSVAEAPPAGARDIVLSPLAVAAGERAPLPERETPTPASVASRVEVDAAPTATLRGRCVDGEGRPLAGVAVALLLEQGADANRVAEAELRHGGVPAWTPPAPVVTGDDGRFAHEFTPPLARRTPILATRPGHVTAHLWPEELTPGDSADVGDVRLPTGYLVRGTVLDRAGEPVGGLALGLRPIPEGSSSWRLSGTTGRDGVFTLRSPAPAGRYEITCAEPLGPLEATRFELGTAAEHFVALTLDRPPVEQAIEGQLVDGAGAPLAGKVVQAAAAGRTWRQCTDAQGRFAFERRADDPSPPVQLGARLEYETVPHSELVPWGTRGLVVAVHTASRSRCRSSTV